MKHATIVDIAKKLEISPSTVSRGLRDHPDVNDETKAMIRKAAKEMYYYPNPIAKSLRNNRTRTIGVIVPEIEHDFFSSAISGIEEVASKSHYTIIVCQSDESYEREIENARLMIGHRVAGVTVSISMTTQNGDHFREISKRHIPLVFFDRVCDDVIASKVIIDDYQSAYDAVSFLIGRGRRRIAHIGGPPTVGIYAKRMQGYRDALWKSKLPTNEKLMTNGDGYEEHGSKAAAALIQDVEMPDAIFAVNDSVAIGALQRIKSAGLRTPQDIAIVGFSNEKTARFVDPPLTTVDQPSKEMGRKAAEILIEAIEGKSTEARTVLIPTHLVIRAST